MDVNFNNSYMRNDNKTNNYYVRAVRSYFAPHTDAALESSRGYHNF
jgi:hypothetical protein